MLRRCYDEKYKKKKPTYCGCKVCEEWHNFTNFYKWIIKQENYSKLVSEKLQLDKDILVKGNKVYSPQNCCLVTLKVNSVLTNRKNDRGSCCIGVIKIKTHGKIYYQARCQIKTKSKRKNFKTEHEAFKCYKQLKEQEIKRIAINEYKKGNITKRCYDALMKYKVNIND